MSTDTISYVVEDRLYLNITDRCTLCCAFCPKQKGDFRVHDYDLSLHHRPTVDEITAALGDLSGYSEVVFCGYGESTLRLNILLEIAGFIKSNSAAKVRVNTDGLANLVHKRNVLPELQGKVDKLSVSMNAQNEHVYNQHCLPGLPGSYQAMLDFLRQAPDYIPAVTATAINGLEGVDITACAEMARQLGVGFRQRQLDVVG